MRHIILSAILAVLALPAAANVNSPSGSPLPDWISEVKVGLLTHDSKMAQDNDHLYHIWEMRKEQGLDLNLEALFNGPDFFHYIGSPRIQLGTNLSLAGDTSYVYSGLDWQYKFQNDIFLGANFGLAVHNGTTSLSQIDKSTGTITTASSFAYNSEKKFGTRTLFHFGPEIGYMLDEHNSLSLNWEHISNGEIISRSSRNANEGEDNLGIRYGYRFN